MERAVLAYDGGFDAAAGIARLKTETGAEVIAVTMDLGQGHVLEDLRDRALAAGAVRAHVLDVREAFATNYVLPSLKADATGAGGVPMVAALGRAVVADKLVEMAGIEQAGAVAHGGGAAGATQSALEAAVRAVRPALRIVTVTPGAGVTAGAHVRSNLWGVYGATRVPKPAPPEPAVVEIRFERGVPARVNGVPMPLVELIGTLSLLAGAHRVGRMQTAEATLDAPAAFVLHAAHRELQQRKAPLKDGDALSRQYAEVVAAGQWPTAARLALDKAVEKAQKRVTGAVKMKLFQGECTVLD